MDQLRVSFIGVATPTVFNFVSEYERDTFFNEIKYAMQARQLFCGASTVMDTTQIRMIEKL